jgi:hypothetical protein
MQIIYYFFCISCPSSHCELCLFLFVSLFFLFHVCICLYYVANGNRLNQCNMLCCAMIFFSFCSLFYATFEGRVPAMHVKQ